MIKGEVPGIIVALAANVVLWGLLIGTVYGACAYWFGGA